MRGRALIVLAVAGVMAAACAGVRAQAVAESAVIHANSGLSAGVAKALGGHIEQSLSQTRGKFAYPPRTSRTKRGTRARRDTIRAHFTGRSPIAISSIVGDSAPCAVAPQSAPPPQAKPPAASSAGTCVAKTPAPVAKGNPSEITVSF